MYEVSLMISDHQSHTSGLIYLVLTFPEKFITLDHLK